MKQNIFNNRTRTEKLQVVKVPHVMQCWVMAVAVINAINQWHKIESSGCVNSEDRRERIPYPNTPYSLPWALEIVAFAWKIFTERKKET